MNKQDIITFFDENASGWDEKIVRNEPVISTILDNGGIYSGVNVLDVACGTGVLFPDYFNRKVASVTGIDISEKMTEIAKMKFPEIEIICADAEATVFEKKFDGVMIYNAFPHFPNPEKLIETMAENLKTGGILSVAHSMSKEALEKHHSGKAKNVSRILPDAEELARLLEPLFDVDIVISNSQMYQVCGKKK